LGGEIGVFWMAARMSIASDQKVSDPVDTPAEDERKTIWRAGSPATAAGMDADRHCSVESETLIATVSAPVVPSL
jgi:hypothetical protein